MRHNFLLATVAIFAIAAPLSGQTITVNKSATEDGVTTFNSVAGALQAVALNPGSDPANPRVIQITDSEIYEETINITAPVVLEATERATLALLSNPNGTPMPDETIGNGGIWINLPTTYTTGTVVLRNLNILPSLTDTTIDRRLRTAIENGNNNLYLELDNCIITANENNAPLVTDPATSRIYAVFPGSTGSPEPYNPDIVQFGGHGIVLGRHYTGYTELDGVELLLKDSIISHLKHDYHPADVEPERFPTGIVMHGPWVWDPNEWDPSLTRITRIEGESGISFCNVLVSASGDLNIAGTDDTPVMLRGSASYHVRLDGPAFNYRVFDNVTMADMSSSGLLDRGFGPIRWTMNNCRMYMVLNSVIRVEVGREGDTILHPAAGQVWIENSTLLGGRFHATAGRSAHTFRFDVDTQTDVHFENSIIGGKRDQNIGVNVISVAGYNNVTANGTALVQSGPFALRLNNPFSRGSNATLPADLTSMYAEDPEFIINTTPNYPAEPDFLNVQNEDYANRNSVGGPLGGGAEYVGPLANVSDWALY